MPFPLIAWAIGGLLLTIAIVVLLKPKADSDSMKPGDVGTPETEEGKPIGVVFGTEWVKDPNVVWFGHVKSKSIKKSGGKK